MVAVTIYILQYFVMLVGVMYAENNANIDGWCVELLFHSCPRYNYVLLLLLIMYNFSLKLDF